MKRSAICWSAAALLTVGMISAANARPGYLAAFKETYNTAQGKSTLNAANCTMCHVGAANSGQWNVYGEAMRTALGAKNVTERPRVVAALRAIEGRTNPVTRETFMAMIQADRLPGANIGTSGRAAGGGGSIGTVNWQPVFNGVDMAGLHKMNQGDWTVQNFILKYTGGGNGWLRSDKQYTNYSSVLVWRYTENNPGNDSGFFLKAPMTGNPWPGGPQLNMGPGTNIGNIGGTQGTSPRADLVRPGGSGEWNTYQVTVQNGRATLAINGQVAWPSATGIPTGPGYLGIQAENRPIEIAQWWVAELP